MLDYGQARDAVQNAGGVWFSATGYDLNLIALRSVPGTLDAFDDWIGCVYVDEKRVRHAEWWKCTTDPGKPSILTPKRSDGTAVIQSGQHRGAFKFGLHHGDYECLVPAQAIPVWRDGNRNDRIEYGPPSIDSTSSTTQIHRANAARESTVVGAWSEGCIVIADPADFARLMELAKLQEANGNGNTFTLTLLDWCT